MLLRTLSIYWYDKNVGSTSAGRKPTKESREQRSFVYSSTMAVLPFVALVLVLSLAHEARAADIAVGAACITGDTCVTGAECDTTAKKCLLITGSSCASPNADYCKTDNVCENSVCKIKATKACTAVANCVANTECSGSPLVCTCKSGYTAQTAGTCSGAGALVGSAIIILLSILLTSRLR